MCLKRSLWLRFLGMHHIAMHEKIFWGWLSVCRFLLAVSLDESWFKLYHLLLEMGHDPTRAYLWPEVNKRPTRLRPGYFLTRPEEIFLTRREKFDVFRGNFPNLNPNHELLTRRDPSHKKLIRPRSKIFDPDPSLFITKKILTFISIRHKSNYMFNNKYFTF